MHSTAGSRRPEGVSARLAQHHQLTGGWTTSPYVFAPPRCLPSHLPLVASTCLFTTCLAASFGLGRADTVLSLWISACLVPKWTGHSVLIVPSCCPQSGLIDQGRGAWEQQARTARLWLVQGASRVRGGVWWQSCWRLSLGWVPPARLFAGSSESGEGEGAHECQPRQAVLSRGQLPA